MYSMKYNISILIIGFLAFHLVVNAAGGDVAVEAQNSIKVIRGPYLQSVSQTGITIRWRTDIPTLSRVMYGREPSSLDRQVMTDGERTEHIVSINGLEPDTKYFYAVGNDSQMVIGGDSLHYFITAPAPEVERPVRIWAIGDFGTADSIPRSVARAYLNYRTGWHTDVWLMLGDIAYTRGTDEQFQEAVFDNMYDELLPNTVVWPTPGNHDLRSVDSETMSGPYYDIFSLPENGECGGVPSGTEAYYSFDYGNIHFVSLDTENTPLDAGSDLVEWLKKDLASNKLKWTIVFFHHPPYSMGTHNSEIHWDSGGRMIRIRENVLPVLDDHGVDLVLSGHSHVYERSYLIHSHYGRARTFKSKMMCRGRKKRYPSAYKKFDGESGTIYVVCGVSGNRPSAGRFQHPVMAFGSDQYRGSMAIEVAGNRLYGIFLDNEGEVQDWFRIEKKPKSLLTSPLVEE